MLRQAVHLFNADPEEGLRAATVRFGLFDASPAGEARFLLEARGLSLLAIGRMLGAADERAGVRLEAFAAAIDWESVDFCRALRYFCQRFRLPGEAQQIQRIMQAFAKWYWVSNPNAFSTPDAAFVLAFTAIMLNTYTHHPSVKQRTTLSAWKETIRGQPEGRGIPDALIERTYRSICRRPIAHPTETSPGCDGP
jgi:Sec7-like guanine-nucleotide exchange factor